MFCPSLGFVGGGRGFIGHGFLHGHGRQFGVRFDRRCFLGGRFGRGLPDSLGSRFGGRVRCRFGLRDGFRFGRSRGFRRLLLLRQPSCLLFRLPPFVLDALLHHVRVFL